MPRKSAESEVDLESLAREFPDVDFSEVFNELYGRHGHRYHRNLQKKLPVTEKRSKTVPISSYQTTYGKVHRVRPRSTKRPPATPPPPQVGPMASDTCQRTSYTPKDFSGRGQLVKMVENYQPSDEPFNGSTVYNKEFTGKFTLPEIKRKPANEGHLKRNDAKFDSRTTVKEHYREWVPQPAITFGELPSFAGSILYPEKAHMPNSTTQASFPGAFAPRTELIKIAEPNLKLEGEMDLTTTTHSTHQKFDGAKPAQMIIHKPQLAVKKRGKFEATTQSQSDFSDLKPGVRKDARPRASSPPPSTIQLGYSSKQEFGTEQRAVFRGHDTVKHPVVKSCKKDDSQYEPPTEKFETLTSQKKDYQPIDIKAAYQSPAKQPQTRQVKDIPKFDSRTTVKDHYKQWVAQPSITFGELPSLAGSILYPENSKIPLSTNADTFRGVTKARQELMKGAEENIKLEGEMDLVTTNQTEFRKPKLKVSRAQADIIRRELAQRRQEKQMSQQTMQQPITAK